MTKDEVKAALIAGETIINSSGHEFDIDWYSGSIDFSRWKIKPKTVTVNGIEVLEPLRVEPEYNDIIYIINTYAVTESIWRDDAPYLIALKNGAIHLTREAATAHYDALWLPTRIKRC